MTDVYRMNNMSIPVDAPAPRLCHIRKVPQFDGYGFSLHAERGRAGQFIGEVDDGSPAAAAGLRDGDRIVEVNGTNVALENHHQVVERVKAVPGEVRLLVVDVDAEAFYRERNVVVTADMPNVIVIDSQGCGRTMSDTGRYVYMYTTGMW